MYICPPPFLEPSIATHRRASRSFLPLINFPLEISPFFSRSVGIRRCDAVKSPPPQFKIIKFTVDCRKNSRLDLAFSSIDSRSIIRETIFFQASAVDHLRIFPRPRLRTRCFSSPPLHLSVSCQKRRLYAQFTRLLTQIVRFS